MAGLAEWREDESERDFNVKSLVSDANIDRRKKEHGKLFFFVVLYARREKHIFLSLYPKNIPRLLLQLSALSFLRGAEWERERK